MTRSIIDAPGERPPLVQIVVTCTGKTAVIPPRTQKAAMGPQCDSGEGRELATAGSSARCVPAAPWHFISSGSLYHCKNVSWLHGRKPSLKFHVKILLQLSMHVMASLVTDRWVTDVSSAYIETQFCVVESD